MANFSAAYSQMFQDSFYLNYQCSRKLAGTTEEMHGLVGDSYKMKYAAQIAMQQHIAYGSDIPAQTPTVTAPSLTFEDWDLKMIIDEFEQLNMNASVVNMYAKAHAKAIGRRLDQLVINAAVAGAGDSVAVGTTNLSKNKLISARSILGLNEVDENLILVMHVNNQAALLKETEVTSADYNTLRALVPGTLSGTTYMGFRILVVGDRSLEGGLPKTGDNRTCIVYAKDSILLGFRMDPTVRTVDVPNNARIETVSLMSAGAKVGDGNGVVTIICDETK